LIYLPRLVVWHQAVKQFGRIDNKNPRRQQRHFTGLAARAQASSDNGFEALGPFAAAVFVSHLAGADPQRASVLSLSFVICRVAYVLAYWFDLDTLRSAVWGLGLALLLALFTLPVW
jgi:uncharacterized MAPEG superfamily protein